MRLAGAEGVCKAMRYEINNNFLSLEVDSFGGRITKLRTQAIAQTRANADAQAIAQAGAAAAATCFTTGAASLPAGVDILQTAPACSAYTPDECGGFPLAPIANRVEDNSYYLNVMPVPSTGSSPLEANEGKLGQGKREKIILKPTSPDGQEYLHGRAWFKEFKLEAQGESFIELSFSDQGTIESGYDYLLIERLELYEASLKVTLTLKHRALTARLYGLGFHPYFAWDCQQDLLKIAAATYYPAGEHNMLQPATDIVAINTVAHSTAFLSPSAASLPQATRAEGEVGANPWNFTNWCQVPDIFANHAYGAVRSFRVRKAALPQHDIVVTAPTCPYLMMYHVPGQHFVALEPQMHAVNAANFPDRGGLRLLSPDSDTLTMVMIIALQSRT